MSALVDLTNRRFGYGVCVSRGPNFVCADGRERVAWNFKCDCGTVKLIAAHLLVSGRTKSCGCMLVRLCREANLQHGLSNTYWEAARLAMVRRCYDSKDKSYHNYGGRGIRVCEELRISTPNLFAVLGHRPSKEFSVHRIDNNGHYSCGRCAECLKCGWSMNVTWATSKTQGRNKRNNRLVTIDGVTRCAVEWRELLGLSRASFEWRYMPDKRAYFERKHTAKYWRNWRAKKKAQV